MTGAADGRLRVVLCWHMHQPQYRDLVTGDSLRPWTYLHGIKDYVDMAVHLETVAGACAVVNFSPVLLEQLDDYCAQVAAHLRTGSPIRDPVLALLTPDGVPPDRAQWPPLMAACLRANDEHGIGRFAPYRELAARTKELLASGALEHASPQLLMDLAAWYHLAWFGETVHRGDARVRGLAERGGPFDAADRRALLECVGDVLSGIVVVVAEHDTHWAKIGQRYRERPLVSVTGGAERCHSVLNGLRKLATQASPQDRVLVHDAARPCLRADDVGRLIETVGDDDSGGLLGVPVADTMKRVNDAGRITQTVERNGLWHALTPQLFRLTTQSAQALYGLAETPHPWCRQWP